MNQTLNKILESCREHVAACKQFFPVSMLSHVAEGQSPPRPFFEALTKGLPPPAHQSVRVIAEVKRKSPSAGLIRPEYALVTFDPASIARAYELAGASAISCLTEQAHFGGDLGFIAQIKGVCALPVLRKDFIIDPYQVIESRAAGADAILLIAECLDAEPLATLAWQAIRLGMSVLIEIHDEANLPVAVEIVTAINGARDNAAGALLGINNRDLSSMIVDIEHTRSIAARVSTDLRAVLVSESGIKTHQDLESLLQIGVQRVLVGEHLMRQASPGDALRQLLQASNL